MSLLLLFTGTGGAPAPDQPSNSKALIAALIAAYSTVTLDNGFIGGRAPYEPRRLPPAITAVQVDNPVPRYHRSLPLIIGSWPKEPYPLPQTTIKLPQGAQQQLVPRYHRSLQFIIASWPREPDPLPIVGEKFPQGARVDNPTPRYHRSLQFIISAWPSVPEPLPQWTRKLPPGTVAPPPADFVQRRNEVPPAVVESWLAPPQYQLAQRKAPQPVQAFVFRPRSWFVAVIESWRVQEQAPPRQRFVPQVVTGQPPFTRKWLAAVRASWEVSEVRAQRAPFFTPSGAAPPVVLPDCGHLTSSVTVGADLIPGLSVPGAMVETISTAGKATASFSRTATARVTITKGGNLKSTITCR